MVRLSPLEELALDEFVHSLRARFGERLTATTLFGSRARGEGREDSDLDLFVCLVGLTAEDRRVVQDLGFDVGCRRGLCISPIVADPATWRSDLPLGQVIAKEGVAL